MTEPESGSDVGKLSTKAERSNGGYVINGQKVFISNARISDHVLVVCRTTKGENKHEGLSMIFVPVGAEGMEMTPIDTMGGRETNTVYFNDCEVPQSSSSASRTAAGCADLKVCTWLRLWSTPSGVRQGVQLADHPCSFRGRRGFDQPLQRPAQGQRCFGTERQGRPSGSEPRNGGEEEAKLLVEEADERAAPPVRGPKKKEEKPPSRR